MNLSYSLAPFPLMKGSRRITAPFFFTAFANYLSYFLNYNVNSKVGKEGGEKGMKGEEERSGWVVTKVDSGEER